MKSDTEKIIITFTGDIMAGMELDSQSRKLDGSFDYSRFFAYCPKLFKNSDYVVGNLETPLAGEEMEYSKAIYCFNTPIEFGRELKKIGVDLVSTANNHCMDRGYEGLLNTLDALKEIGLPQVGTSRNSEERAKSFIVDIKGFKIGFAAFTYGTNAFAHHLYLPEDCNSSVNLLQPQEELPGAIHLLNSPEQIQMETEALYQLENEVFSRYVAVFREQLKSELLQLRRDGAEFTVLLLHSGGQYNVEVDPFTQNVVEYITQGAYVDCIIGNHPHVPQAGKIINSIPVAFSLGNFAYVPRNEPVNTLNYAEYSLVASLELKRDKDKVVFERMGFEIAKSVNNSAGFTEVLPITQLRQRLKDDPTALKQLDDDLCMVAGRARNEAPESVVLQDFFDWL